MKGGREIVSHALHMKGGREIVSHALHMKGLGFNWLCISKNKTKTLCQSSSAKYSRKWDLLTAIYFTSLAMLTC